MKHLIYFEDYLTESVLNIDTIYNKYYSNIEKDIFDKIIESDPTTIVKDSKMGVYCKWLLKLYANNKLKLEDLYKATQYLSAFHQFKHKIHQKDINFYKSLPELFKVVEPFLEKEDVSFENDEERKLAGQFKEVFRNDAYRIIIPLTLKASQYFGQGTEWCTTNTDMFKKYTKKQNGDEITPYNLYILYTENPNDRMQFHFKSRQFMDIDDQEIEIGIDDFFEENRDIYDFFNKYFNVNKYYLSGTIRWRGNTLDGAPEMVYGDFYCNNLGLTSLKGSPQTVEGDFFCNHNNLDSLEGGPQTIECSYVCDNNILVNLKGSPEIMEGTFSCVRNKLTSLEGAPKKVDGNFICVRNPDLSEEEIIRYYNTGAVKGTIISDYGDFTPKK